MSTFFFSFTKEEEADQQIYFLTKILLSLCLNKSFQFFAFIANFSFFFVIICNVPVTAY